MEKINNTEYKKIILDILKYIDSLCRKNNIKYTLTGGSLIGAIREKGIIPWDDDIDIVLNKEEYEKLLKLILKDNNKNYVIMDNRISDDYPHTYAKLIDIRTAVKEKNTINIKNYGAFVDIFVNHKTSNNYILRIFHYIKIKIYQSLINGYLYNDDYIKQESGLKKIRTIIAKKIGIRKLQKKYRKIITMYDNKETLYVVKDYIGFGFNKDIMRSNFFDEYIDVDFENIKAMSVKKYDEYLKNLFGNYMIRPPKEKQICHNIEAYWKNKEEK